MNGIRKDRSEGSVNCEVASGRLYTGSQMAPQPAQFAALGQPAIVTGDGAFTSLFFKTIPFWLLLAYGSFLPATLTPWFQILGVPVDSFDFLMTATAVFYVLMFLISPIQSSPVEWNRRLPLWTAGILCFAALSFLWNGLEGLERRAMAVNLAVSVVTVALSYFLVLYVPAERLDDFLFLLAAGISVVGLAYSAESFLGLNLRSELGRSYSVGFGIDRVHGPLFASSRGHIILLPAVAYMVQGLMVDRTRRVLKTVILLSLVVTCLGLGSRAALLLLLFFALTLCWVARKRMSAVIMFLGIVALSVGLVFSIASGERLESMIDSGRLTTHVTALETLRGRGFALDVAGTGYGSIWHWYLEDVTMGDKIIRGWLMRWTEYGMTLYNSHSLVLLLILELGALGLVYLAKIWSVLAGIFLAGLRRGPTGVFACGVAISGLSMLAEIMIFKEPKTSAIWLIFLFAALKSESKQ
jgi:hypothetical protein